MMEVQQPNRTRTTPLEDGDGDEGLVREETKAERSLTNDDEELAGQQSPEAEEFNDAQYEGNSMGDEARAEDAVSADSDTDNEKRPVEDPEDNSNASVEARGLYKSTRLRGYITLTLASFIHYDAADNSSGGEFAHVSVVPSTPDQRRYAVAASLVSLLLSAACLLVHLDRITPLRRIWSVAFGPGSRWEGALLIFLTIWWTVATGVDTSVSGIAGDGRGQFSLYYSTWVCCFTCYWMMERWLVAAGVSNNRLWMQTSPKPHCHCLAVLESKVLYRELAK